jgi:hypothetical protein
MLSKQFGIVTASAFVLLATQAVAQEQSFKFEITPFAAYRVGGSFEEKDGDGRVELNDSNAQGIMFNIKANPNGQYEFLYARQSTDARTEGFLLNDPTIDLDVETFHFGGTYLFDGENTRPFLALTIGITQFDPDRNMPTASFMNGLKHTVSASAISRKSVSTLSTPLLRDCDRLNGSSSSESEIMI